MQSINDDFVRCESQLSNRPSHCQQTRGEYVDPVDFTVGCPSNSPVKRFSSYPGRDFVAPGRAQSFGIGEDLNRKLRWKNDGASGDRSGKWPATGFVNAADKIHGCTLSQHVVLYSQVAREYSRVLLMVTGKEAWWFWKRGRQP